jgi:hypothetical protein
LNAADRSFWIAPSYFMVFHRTLTTWIAAPTYRREDDGKHAMTVKWRRAAIVCVMALITSSECLAQTVRTGDQPLRDPPILSFQSAIGYPDLPQRGSA